MSQSETTANPAIGTLLFATGGSGGHIFPALAIAEEAKHQGYDTVFIGQRHGMEARLVPEAGFRFHGVTAGKWDRGQANPFEAIRAVTGTLEALRIVQREKPVLVLGFGGFASFPGLAAARLLRKPYLLHESNAYPGKVIQWFASSAAHVVLSQQATRKFLPNITSSLIGYPVREKRIDKLEARRQLGLAEEGLLTLVMGGSQGSKSLNENVPAAYRALANTPGDPKNSVIHSTGRGWEESVRALVSDLDDYHVTGFVDGTLAWSAADLAITRGGYGTLSEAAYHGVPAIVVPLPSSAEDHQLHNARSFAKTGAGWVMEESKLDSLSKVWNNARLDSVRAAAALAAAQLSPEGAPGQFLTLINALVAGKVGDQALQEIT